MTTIEQLLGDLLLRHNCVIVPTFGGFVAKQVSARVDFEAGKMSPPRKSLLFNKQLINNDGLLINELSQSNGLSYEEAQSQVHKKVEDWNRSLRNSGRIELDRIGYLYFDAEKNLCFEQDRFFNLLLESFGLGQVHFLTEQDVKIVERTIVQSEQETKIIPIEQAVAVEKPEVLVAIDDKKEEKVIVAPRRKVWRYVAAACILPIAFYSAWIPMKTDVLESGVISLNDFNPFHTRTEGSYEQINSEEIPASDLSTPTIEEQIEGLPEDVKVYTYEFDEGFTIPVSLESAEFENSGPPVQEPVFQANAMHYIVGCFGQESNATNLVLKLQNAGLDAKIVDVQNGLHRVSAGSGISLEALSDVKATVSGLGYKGWTLK
ncbi:MAG: hypothetical protein QNK23_01480 [Crocinitomicaceae bacterium]|nr:hypothetical protein [Crocinitomicaceae bacterium]